MLTLLLFVAYLVLVVRAVGRPDPVDCSCFGGLGESRVTPGPTRRRAPASNGDGSYQREMTPHGAVLTESGSLVLLSAEVAEGQRRVEPGRVSDAR